MLRHLVCSWKAIPGGEILLMSESGTTLEHFYFRPFGDVVEAAPDLE